MLMIVSALRPCRIRTTCINGEWFVKMKDIMMVRNADDVFLLLNQRYSDRDIRASKDIFNLFLGVDNYSGFYIAYDNDLPNSTIVSSEMNCGFAVRAKNVMIKVERL